MKMDRIKVEAQAGKLASDEVDALHEIYRELGKKDWDFNVDPCSNHSSWRNPDIDPRRLYNDNTLLCNSPSPAMSVMLYLRGQDMSGVLPPSLGKLPHIKVINVFKSSTGGKNLQLSECLQSYPCSKGNIVYEVDLDQGGEAKYIPTGSNWEVSSTGHFWDTRISSTDHIAHNGTRMLKDFNIESTIKGVDKAYIHEFKYVTVRDKTLEIRFHWVGKGTTTAPKRGTYGPLISAISVKHEFKPPNDGQKKIFIVVRVLVSLLILVLMILGVLWWKGWLWARISREEELKGLNLKTRVFTLRQIKVATNNFDAANKIWEGGFGSVYKGILLDGTIIAVKQLSSRSKQGNHEFVNEI
ncbi:hypothetical protein F3Y22_tig00112217pilonHSYRG00163 [Hibiscus syriacus]|uniref:non-specific serine/threonine protein kinase n=1 Tax=Hibiscus syriacus TaxID=106335 RepID=A0A6A2X4Q4_HIBSY|nr:hypothetical protein F3Y22_tig00112217pilonHSYRG00163 [Hibiscus syriacus]